MVRWNSIRKLTLFFSILIVSGALPISAGAQVGFVDFTVQAKIDHNHNGFMYGGGAACADFNGDGFLDLLIPDGVDNDNLLFINQGDGSFKNLARESGIAGDGEGLGAVAADIDNDGDIDVYVANYFTPNQLFLNNGEGVFVEVSEAAGVADPGPSTSVAMADVDNDGFLDIYVLNRSQAVTDYACRLYRNNGDGTFTDITQQAGVGFEGTSLGVGFFDFDNDRDLDLYVADEFGKDAFYRNEGNGTFTNIINDAFSNRPSDGMGVDFTDYNNDGLLDLYIGNFSPDYLFKNNGDGTFDEVARDVGITNPGIAWGVNFFDCDNDGDKDLYVINGEMHFGFKRKPNLFYLNNGDGTFTEGASSLGIAEDGDGRGSVRADFNNDGYEDLFFVNVSRGKSVLYMNKGGRNHWIELNLVGTRSNRSGVGARVELYADDKRYIDEVRAGSSYASMHPLTLHFGLGKVTMVDSIRIYWPSGTEQTVYDVSSVDRILTISEPGQTTAVGDDRVDGVPNSFALLQNHPNPFNPETVIPFRLAAPASVTIAVLTTSGREIAAYELGEMAAGEHSYRWQGRTALGRQATSGVYLYRIQARTRSGERFVETRKMILLR